MYDCEVAEFLAEYTEITNLAARGLHLVLAKEKNIFGRVVKSILESLQDQCHQFGSGTNKRK